MIFVDFSILLRGDLAMRSAASRVTTPRWPQAGLKPGAVAFGLALLGSLAGGCAHAPVNVPLARADPATGYRFQTTLGHTDRSGLMVALFFSGGGTRAAAFSYGVLRELAATRIPGDRRMLDDVTTINAVSGGSFTAAYYCLYGDRIFADYEKLFLKRNIQDALLGGWLSPHNGFRLCSPYFGRSDLAAEYYDKVLFHGATFGDLAKAGPTRPFLVINATNISTSTAVQFTQDQFDLIGSDLSRFPISRAVAASSAVPLAFSPIVLKNYADRVPAADAFLLQPKGGSDIFGSYRAALTETSLSYRDVAKQPYIHLMDGGLADNLSLRNLLDSVTLSGGWEAVLDRLRKGGITKLAIIVVNAAVQGKQDWALLEDTPGIRSVITALSNSSINRTTKETVTLVEDSLALWQTQRAAQRGAPKIYLIRVDFHVSQDPAERAFLDSVPTSLALPPETADRLIQDGERLLRESPAYQDLLKNLALRGAP
jgi:NTE family protein